MACILIMCTVGSYAAFKVENVVLGGFTLILTFCIGIRFLVKPDTSRKKRLKRGQSLAGKVYCCRSSADFLSALEQDLSEQAEA